MSRWTMPAACATCSASAMSIVSDAASAGVDRAARDALAQRDPLDELHDEVADVVLRHVSVEERDEAVVVERGEQRRLGTRTLDRAELVDRGHAGSSPPPCGRGWCLPRDTRAPCRPRRSARRAGSGRPEARRSRSLRSPEVRSLSLRPCCHRGYAEPHRSRRNTLTADARFMAHAQPPVPNSSVTGGCAPPDRPRPRPAVRSHARRHQHRVDEVDGRVRGLNAAADDHGVVHHPARRRCR